MILKTTDLPIEWVLNEQEQAALLESLNSNKLFDTPRDPRVAKPRPQFEFGCGTAPGHCVLSVTSDGTEHPNVLRLVKVILRMN
jgi:hypothetical protein